MSEAAVIIPVHNRRDTTLACLRLLEAQGVPEWAAVLVVDDGSTDGTSALVRERHPGVRLLAGDGGLYWTGAVARGMQAAFEAGTSHCLWLNDDCAPEPGSLRRLLELARSTGAVAGGVCLDPHSGTVAYGGFVVKSHRLVVAQPPQSGFREVDALNGNLACIPRAVFERIGLPDARRLPHAHGDTDYTLRARRAGFRVLLSRDASATATPHAAPFSWLEDGDGVTAIWRHVFSRRSYDYLPANWVFHARHFGLRGIARGLGWALRLPAISLARLVLPRPWLRALAHSRGRGSQAGGKGAAT